jgi:hypothetical protein
MGIDASIPLSAKPIQLASPFEFAQNALAIQNGQQQQQMNALNYQTAMRNDQETQASQNALRNFYASNQDPAALAQLGQASPKAYEAYQQQLVDREQKKAQTKKDLSQANNFDSEASSRAQTDRINQVTHLAQLLRGVTDQASYDRAVEMGHTIFGKSADVPAQYDPAVVQNMLNFTLSQAQANENQRGLAADATTRRGQDITATTTRRGQDMTAQTASNALDFAKGSAGAGKPLTESQGKALQFGKRMQDANAQLAQLEQSGVTNGGRLRQGVEGLPVVGGALGAVANTVATSPQQQSYEQAKQNFILAALRDESGAAIGSDEYRKYEKTFFPSVGDDKATIAQKAESRKKIIEGMAPKAGPQGADLGGGRPPATQIDLGGGIKFMGFE